MGNRRVWPLRFSGAILFVCLACPLAAGQSDANAGLVLNTGREIYQAACAACHGPDGKGTPQSTAGFERPNTFPDFTRCDQTTPELDVDWKAVIREGGPFRGFSQIMPSFGAALTPAQIDRVVAYVRGFCREPAWPRGELNLPRPLVTEKAFPEDEVVLTSTVNAQGAPGVATEITHEQRFGVKNQIEVSVPVNFVHPDHAWYGGFGDTVLGLKRELFSSLRSGSILSVQGEVSLPSGSRPRGLGSGVTSFEMFAAYGQLLPADSFVQFQMGGELPTDTALAPRAMFWRTALGKSFRQGRGLGRMWSPTVEFLADRDFEQGAKTNWDIMPQMQVTLSRRQHVRANAGVRIPVTNTAGRSVQVAFYLLWDWFDGKINEGW
jgi:mono/diheme cytochrome c family protein